MGLNLDYIYGQTPIDEDEREGLLISTIATRGELDEFEQQNIEKAVYWTLTRNSKQSVILTEAFVRQVHKKMFDQVWSWAGEFRKTNKNIGVDKWQIRTELKSLFDDVHYWIENKTFIPDEIAVRFKHRIVSIHCFPNGNGRHSRLMADLIIDKIYNKPVFSWGVTNLAKESESRTIYINAVKAADQGDYSLLIEFARS